MSYSNKYCLESWLLLERYYIVERFYYFSKNVGIYCIIYINLQIFQ